MQTRLNWELFLGDGSPSGTFTWPMSSNPVENHASELVKIAEASFRQGCPLRHPPPEVLGSLSPPVVNSRDASSAYSIESVERLRRLMEEAVLTPECVENSVPKIK